MYKNDNNPQVVAPPAQKSTIAKLNALQQIGCSSVSGCAGIFVGFPFDTVRVRLQTAQKGRYTGVINCVRKIIAEEGFLKLYAGMSAPLSVAAVRQSVIFGSNRIFNQMLSIDNTIFHHEKKDTNVIVSNYYARKMYELEEEIEEIIDSKYFKLWISGMMTGVCNSFVVTPSDQVKIMVQSGGSNSPISCLTELYKQGGIRNGLFRGWRASVLRELFYYGSYFIAYESYRNILSRVNPFSEHRPIPSHNIFHPSTMFECLLAGGLAGCTSWLVNLPADYIKSRLQNDNIKNPQYKGIADCARKTYASHGRLGVFFTGLVPTLTRAFPVHATIFITFELMKQLVLDHNK